MVIEKVKKKLLGNAHAEDTDLSADDLKVLVSEFKKLVKSRTGKAFPNDPWDQLRGAVGAVFSSWMNDRAIVYRRKYNILKLGHGCKRSVHGVRQHRRRFRFRRGIHPRPWPQARTNSGASS